MAYVRQVVVVSLSLLASGLLHGDSIFDQMTAEEKARSGLEKLSAEERAFLSEWTAMIVSQEREQAVNEIIPEGDDRFGADEQIQRNVNRIRPEQKELVSTISGAFKGWSGDTLFRLDNGQLWKQSQRGKFVINVEDPVVTIEKGLFGAYFLSVEGYGSRIKVERLK